MFKGLREKLHKDLIIIGIAVIIAGFVASTIIGNFKETAVETAASIIEIVEPEEASGLAALKGTTVMVEYIVDGESYEHKLGYYEEGMIEGQTVMVLYDPENPASMRAAEGPDTVKAIYITGACIAGFGIICNLIMKRNERKRADRRAEKRVERKNSK